MAMNDFIKFAALTTITIGAVIAIANWAAEDRAKINRLPEGRGR
jgi:hypothetical protein